MLAREKWCKCHKHLRNSPSLSARVAPPTQNATNCRSGDPPREMVQDTQHPRHSPLLSARVAPPTQNATNCRSGDPPRKMAQDTQHPRHSPLLSARVAPPTQNATNCRSGDPPRKMVQVSQTFTQFTIAFGASRTSYKTQMLHIYNRC